MIQCLDLNPHKDFAYTFFASFWGRKRIKNEKAKTIEIACQNKAKYILISFKKY